MLLTVVPTAAARDANDARTTRLTCAIPRYFLGPALNCARLVLEGRRGARPSGFTEWSEDAMNRVRRGSSKSMRVRSGRGARCVLPLGGVQCENLKKFFRVAVGRGRGRSTFGRSVEFVRFVLMMTGAKTRPVDVARCGVTKRASSRALRAYECGSCLRTVPCLRRAAQIGCRSPRRSTTWSPKARRGWFLMVFAPKTPRGSHGSAGGELVLFYSDK